MQCSGFRLGRREIPKFFLSYCRIICLDNFSRVLEYFSSGDCPLFGIVSDTLVYLYLIYLKVAVCGDFGFQDDESSIRYENVTQTEDNDNLLEQSFFPTWFELFRLVLHYSFEKVLPSLDITHRQHKYWKCKRLFLNKINGKCFLWKVEKCSVIYVKEFWNLLKD